MIMRYGSKPLTDDNQANGHTHDETRGAHDLGGFPNHLLANGIDTSISRAEMPKKPYEERADAMLLLLSNTDKGLLNIHAMRRASEQFTHEDYLKLSYYDRWLRAMAALCIETGVFSKQEWQAKHQQVITQNKATQQEGSD